MKLQLLAKLSPLAFILCSPLVGQTVYTDPVGAVVMQLTSGTSVIANPFQKPKLFQGAVSSVSANTVSLSVDISAEISLPAYVQVISGSSNTTGLISSIESLDGFDLLLSSPIVGLESGDVIAVREHIVVADYTPFFPVGTQITLLNGSGFSPTVAVRGFTGWGANANVPIYPGEGMIVNLGSGRELVVTGSVAVDDVKFYSNGGSVVVGNVDPIDGLSSIIGAISTLPIGTQITQIVAGTPVVYVRGFAGWNPSLNNLSIDGLNSIIVNSANPFTLNLPGF